MVLARAQMVVRNESSSYVLFVASVLLAEDDTAVRRALERTLVVTTLVGVRVRSVGSASEVEALLDVHKDWAGFLFDVHLDRARSAEGLALARRVGDEHPNAPCLVMTADAHAEISNAVALLPTAKLLRKPLPDASSLEKLLVPIAERARELDLREQVIAWGADHGLTPAERSAVASWALGLTAREYAARERISVSTFRTHLENARRRLGLGTLPELRALAENAAARRAR